MVRLRTAALVTGLFCLGAAPLFAEEAKKPFLNDTWDNFRTNTAPKSIARTGCDKPTVHGGSRMGAFMRGARQAITEQKTTASLRNMKEMLEDRAACKEYLPRRDQRGIKDYGQILRMVELLSEYRSKPAGDQARAASSGSEPKFSLLDGPQPDQALQAEDALLVGGKKSYRNLDIQIDAINKLREELIRKQGKSQLVKDSDAIRAFLFGSDSAAQLTAEKRAAGLSATVKKTLQAAKDLVSETSSPSGTSGTVSDRDLLWQLLNDQEADYACCIAGHVSGRMSLMNALLINGEEDSEAKSCKAAFSAGKQLAVMSCADNCFTPRMLDKEFNQYKPFASCLSLGMMQGFACDPWFDQEYKRICPKNHKPVSDPVGRSLPTQPDADSGAAH